jgi:hypothetical protein
MAGIFTVYDDKIGGEFFFDFFEVVFKHNPSGFSDEIGNIKYFQTTFLLVDQTI